MAAAAKQGVVERTKVVLRQFVVRLEQPGLYDRLFDASLRRSREEGRHVPMTDIAREAIEKHLDDEGD
jgi:hypothetical protein